MKSLRIVNCFLLMLAVLMIAKADLHCLESLEASQQKPNLKAPADDPNLSTFANAIKVAGLQDLFEGTGPFTAFIPSNAAFDKFGKAKLKELLKPENKDQLSTFLLNSIVSGKYSKRSLHTMTLKALNGKMLEIKVEGNGIWVDKAKIISNGQESPNGIYYVIDTVIGSAHMLPQ